MLRFTLFALCSVLLGMPLMAQAQEFRPLRADQQYCIALSKSYQRYVVSSTTTPRANAAGGYAKAACKQEHPLAGIPILGAKLENAKVPLPYQPAARAR